MTGASFSDTRKKKIGRPRVGSIPIMLRMPPEVVAEIDRAISEMTGRNSDPFTRQEIIRMWIDDALLVRRRRWDRQDKRKKG